jgi:flagella basal body P-ring formation protein FlgA
VVGVQANETVFALLWPEFRLKVRTTVRLRHPGATVRSELAAGVVLTPELIKEVHDGSLLLDRTYVTAAELAGRHLRRVVKPGSIIRRGWVAEATPVINDTAVTAMITVGAAQIKAPARWVRAPDEGGSGLVRLEGKPKIFRALRTAEGAEIRVP